jgi:hypothetical protein
MSGFADDRELVRGIVTVKLGLGEGQSDQYDCESRQPCLKPKERLPPVMATDITSHYWAEECSEEEAGARKISDIRRYL